MVETRHSEEALHAEETTRGKAVPARAGGGRSIKSTPASLAQTARKPTMLEKALGANDYTFVALMTARARHAWAGSLFCC